MSKLDAAGCMIQWLVELSQLDIEYRPITVIKAQALADFIAEFTLLDLDWSLLHLEVPEGRNRCIQKQRPPSSLKLLITVLLLLQIIINYLHTSYMCAYYPPRIFRKKYYCLYSLEIHLGLEF